MNISSCLRRIGVRIVAVGLCAMLTGATAFGQSAEVQSLRIELEALKQRVAALQREVDTLKGQPRPAGAAAPSVPLDKVVLRLDRRTIRGSASAPITLVEVSDFECPFCGRHFKQTSQLIEKNYVETGKIRVAFVHFPIASHRNALKAAEAASCAADQGKFWQMHDRLFSNQAQLAAPQLPDHGSAVGLDGGRFRACLDKGTQTATVQNEMTMAQRAGVTATPTFFVGKLDPQTQTLNVIEKIVGAKAFAAFQQSLDSALARN